MTERLYKIVELDSDGCIQSEDYIPPGSIVKVDTPEAMRHRIKMKEKRERVQYLRSDNPFTFVKIETVTSMKPEILSKVVYLSTFMKFNNDKLMKTERKQMSKKDLPEVLKISSKQVNGFLKETAGIIFSDNDGHLSINTDMFCRSSLKGNMFNKFTRAYAKGIQSLYNSVTVRQHKQLGYLFVMLPYLNREFNVLCVPDDILETDSMNIRTISFNEFCDLIGYARHNANRLKTAYKKLRFSDKDGREWDFLRIIDAYGKIYINPNIFYAGDDLKRVELLNTLFS